MVPLYDQEAVAAEVARQLAMFRELIRNKPTHLDSHQHVHRDEPVRSIPIDLAHELRVPLRSFTPEVDYCGDFYGQWRNGAALPEAIDIFGLLRILAGLQQGITELSCHPALESDSHTMYDAERIREAETLRDPRIRTLLDAEGIELRSFEDVLMR